MGLGLPGSKISKALEDLQVGGKGLGEALDKSKHVIRLSELIPWTIPAPLDEDMWYNYFKHSGGSWRILIG